MKSRHGRPPALAETRFAKKAGELKGKSHKQIFTYIHETNLWGADTSTSGLGSELIATSHIRAEIPKLLKKLKVKTLLDIPCGDFSWLRQASLPISHYIGADIVDSIIEKRSQEFANANNNTSANVPNTNSKIKYEFRKLDLVKDKLPKVDLILCRDCLVHFSYKFIAKAISNIKKSGSRYLLTTTFTELLQNIDVQDGDWRPLNLEVAPFSFSKPQYVINEKCMEGDGAYADKSLGLWEISSLP